MAERGLDFLDALLVFAGETLDFQDTREDYGEDRFICVGHLGSRMVVIGVDPSWRRPPRLQHEKSK